MDESQALFNDVMGSLILSPKNEKLEQQSIPAIEIDISSAATSQ